MKKPVRKIRRTIRREFGRKGKGKGKGKRRRLHGRGVLAFLASLPDTEYEEVLFGKGKGKGKGRRNTSGKGKGRKGNPKDRDGKTMECDICGSTQHFRRECPKGDGKGRSPSAHLAQTSDEVEYVDLESFFASDTTTSVYFMAMRYMNAAGFLTEYTEELFEAFFPDGDADDLE